MVHFNNLFIRINLFICVFLLLEVSTFRPTSEKFLPPKLNATSITKLRILAVFHHPGKSHFDFFKPLLEELAHRDHEMTVVSYFPRNVNLTNSEVFRNYRDINIGETLKGWINVIDLTQIDYSFLRNIKGLFFYRQWSLETCQLGLNVPEVRELIRSDEKFDLVLTENFNSDCFLGFAHRFQAPFIALSSHQIIPWGNPRMGNPDNPSYIPVSSLGFSPQMNFFSRIFNTVYVNFAKSVYEIAYQWPTQKIVEEVFGPGVPPLSEIAKSTSALLTNTHYSLHGARPYVPNVVEVGGLHIRPVKPLPENIKKFLDEATEGAVLFSWGSMVKASSLPKKKLEVILRVIGSIPRKVIWKWEVNDFPQQPKNLMVLKWLPQFDIMSEYKHRANLRCQI